ncbi:M48 family metalloprotease [Taklimakanibacter deserti]|uniref:M48 family metalloprotease n=1 Tax=Taklimakanibacter deserti TaxID=2267839 RepID=UPI000E64FADE
MTWRRITGLVCATSFAIASLVGPAFAQAKRSGPSLIRDAEIESLMRLYTKPIFQAAGLNPGSVHVYLINDPRINAFVAGGQRIFINTGLLTQAKTPNEVIGVLAHETGHISGGHLARMQNEIDRKSTIAIIGMLLGAAAVAGGAVAGEGELAQAGGGIMMGAQGLTQRLVLSYARAMEASADQAAIKFLTATGQSGKGMLTLFQKLATQSMASLRDVSPYVMSHPMPLDRIRNLEVEAKASKYFDTPDKPEIMMRHKLMQAKLVGFLQPMQTVFQRYPTSDTSLPGRYARAIAMFRSGDTRNAVKVIDTLIRDLPSDPYFHELKGQALLEGGQPAQAVAPLRQTIKMLPNSGLIRIMLAQALLGTENRANAQAALSELRLARKTEDDTPALYQLMAMAYGQIGDIPRADLATAEAAYYRGDKKLAEEKAKVAMRTLKRGSPDWLRANDILNFVNRE